MAQLLESAERLAEIAKVGGFQALGKDLMRAAERQRQRGSVPETEGVVVFDRRLDFNKAKKQLTPSERRLVSVLKEKPNEVISEADLHEKIYGKKNSRGSVKKLVSRARGKIEDDPKKPKKILTEFGEGYLWRETTYFNSELSYDPDRFVLTVGDKHFVLGERQSAVFGLLVENSGNVVTFQKFSKEIWDKEYERRLVNTYINSIRCRVKNATGKKLESIVSVPGVGYKLVDPSENNKSINGAPTVFVG